MTSDTTEIIDATLFVNDDTIAELAMVTQHYQHSTDNGNITPVIIMTQQQVLSVLQCYTVTVYTRISYI